MGNPFTEQSVIADWTNVTGATAASGAIVDTDGYERVLLLGKLETTNANHQLVALGGTATDAMSEYTGPNSGEASGIAPRLYLDIHRPRKRYIQGQVFASAGAINCEVLTILYGARVQPTTNATTVNGRQLASPNSGTATATG